MINGWKSGLGAPRGVYADVMMCFLACRSLLFRMSRSEELID